MKKILSLILAIFMILSAMPVFAQSDNTTEVYVDIQKTEDSKNLMAAIDVVPHFPAELTEGVKRADFLSAVVAVLKCSLYDNGTETCFHDVRATDSFCSAVNYALDLGIISEGTYFRPHDYITYGEAAKMITVALGYDIDAISKGGWPYGYIAVANSLDLNSGLSLNAGDVLNSSQSYIMLANMLESDIRIAAGIISSNGEYSVRYDEGSNILTLLYDWIPFEGVATANSITSLYDNTESLSPNFWRIGSGVYYTTEDILLGSNLKGYFTKEGSRNVIQYFTADYDSVCEIYPDNDPTFSESKIEYYDDSNKEQRANLESVFAVTYNGKACYDYTAADFDIEVGKIILVDSNDNSKFDVAHIYKGEILIPDIVNSSTQKAVDSRKGITLDLSDEDKITVFEGGVGGSKGYVSAGAVLEYYPDKSGEYVVVNILTNVITGKVTGTGSGLIYVDDVPYKYVSYFEQYFMPNITIGTSYTFFLTESGATAALDLTGVSSAYKLAYIYRIRLSSGLDPKVRVRGVSQDGGQLETTLADKIIVDGKTSVKAQELYSSFSSASQGQLIRYKLNADGEISAIWLPEAEASSRKDSVYDDKSDGKDVIKPYVLEGVEAGTSIRYKESGLFLPHFSIDSNTVIFCISPDEQLDDERRYTIGTMSSWRNDNQFDISEIKPYNVNNAGYAGILVVSRGVSDDLNADQIAGGTIESVTYAFDSYGEKALKILLCSKGSYSTVYLPENNDYYVAAINESAKTALGIGDYIVYTKNDMNSILSYKREYDYSEDKVEHVAPGGTFDSLYIFVSGTLDSIYGTSISLDVTSASSSLIPERTVLKMNQSHMTLVDIPAGIVSASSFNLASDYAGQGRRVVLRVRYGSIEDIVIYKTE